MLKDRFTQRKKSTLLKIDKSSKGDWDKKIIPLCKKINHLDNYYTTSSCSGRVVLIIDNDKKKKDLFLKVYHDLISFEQLKEDLNEIARALHSELRKVINKEQLTKNFMDNKVLAERLGKARRGAINSQAQRVQIIKFKQEPCILHIACRSLEDALGLLKKARVVGFKRAGIISASKDKFVLELISTEKLEFPIIKNKKILVDNGFLKLIVKKSNENLKKSWGKIEKLKKLLK